MMPTISIIIPTYHPGEYFEECLASLLHQTIDLASMEILIILNGDRAPYEQTVMDTIERLGAQEYASLLYSRERGVSRARNFGIAHARGEYISFVDDDDILSPQYLAELLKVSSRECVGCATSVSFTEQTSHSYPNFLTRHYDNCRGKRFSQFRFRGFLSPPFCKLIHRDIIGRTRFDPRVALGEDSLFCLGLVPKIKRMRLAEDTAIYYYRMRPGSALHKRPDRWRDFVNLLTAERGYFAYYLRHPLAYNPLYLMSRVVGAMVFYVNRSVIRKYCD